MDELSFEQRLQILKDRYWLAVGPLVLMIAVGLGTAAPLAWIAGGLLLALTVNKVLPATH